MNWITLFCGIGIGFFIATILFYIIVVKMVWTARDKAKDEGTKFNGKLLELWAERNRQSEHIIEALNCIARK